MKGIKLKAVLAGRKGALLGAAVAVAGLSLLGTTAAHAAIGTSAGTLTFNTMSGATSLSTAGITWSQASTAACPSTANGSAKLVIVTADGVDEQSWSAYINGAASALTNKALLSGTIAGFLGNAGIANGTTAELIVNCYSGASGAGTLVPFNDAWISVSSDGLSFTISDTAPAGPVTPTVTLSAQPTTVQIGANVNLTATVMAGTTPVTTGTVQFEQGGNTIGSAVAVSASGVATTSTTFATATGSTPLALTAVYQTGNATLFNGATSNTVNETVTATNPNSNSQLITVTVAPSGSFSFTGPSTNPPALTQSGLTATGSILPVTVTDTRTGLAPQGTGSLANGFNGYPGWSVVGSATDFTDPTSQPAGDIPVAGFNWSPVAAPAAGSGTDYTLAGASTTGLGTAQTLANAATGHGDGTFGLGAGLTLAIPASAPAGAYSSTLTLTANPLANFS